DAARRTLPAAAPGGPAAGLAPVPAVRRRGDGHGRRGTGVGGGRPARRARPVRRPPPPPVRGAGRLQDAPPAGGPAAARGPGQRGCGRAAVVGGQPVGRGRPGGVGTAAGRASGERGAPPLGRGTGTAATGNVRATCPALASWPHRRTATGNCPPEDVP